MSRTYSWQPPITGEEILRRGFGFGAWGEIWKLALPAMHAESARLNRIIRFMTHDPEMSTEEMLIAAKELESEVALRVDASAFAADCSTTAVSPAFVSASPRD